MQRDLEKREVDSIEEIIRLVLQFLIIEHKLVTNRVNLQQALKRFIKPFLAVKCQYSSI